MSKNKSRTLFLLLFFMLPLNVYSATNEYSSNYSLCLNQANGASAEAVNCNRVETAVQDKRLNEEYRRYLASINAALRTATIKSQRAWVTFRDAECDAEYAIEAPGSNAEVMRTACILDMTLERANKYSHALSSLKP
ncbi:MAG: lysozyme inhibitor LprI family protein [Erwinia billingiae]